MEDIDTIEFMKDFENESKRGTNGHMKLQIKTLNNIDASTLSKLTQDSLSNQRDSEAELL